MCWIVNSPFSFVSLVMVVVPGCSRMYGNEMCFEKTVVFSPCQTRALHFLSDGRGGSCTALPAAGGQEHNRAWHHCRSCNECRNYRISWYGRDPQGSASPTRGPAQDSPKIPPRAWEHGPDANVTSQFCHLMNFKIRHQLKSPQTLKTPTPLLYFPAVHYPVDAPAVSVSSVLLCANSLCQWLPGKEVLQGVLCHSWLSYEAFSCLSLRISCCELSQSF